MSLSTNHSKKSNQEILQEVEAILVGNFLTDMANTAALLMSSLDDINWVGFYLLEKDNQLWLGPFQGLPACTSIPLNKGVCGAAATARQTLIVPDVDAFPGHIVCDSRSKSEIVIPLIVNENLIGVLDVDSASTNRFQSADLEFLETVVSILLNKNRKNTKLNFQI